MRIAVLVKQVPRFEEIELGTDGRLRRDGVDLEMNPYCRRAVSQAAILAGGSPGSTVTVFTLGPPAAADTLREAIAWLTGLGVDASGVHLCGPEFAGSDTLATARALAAAIRGAGPFDLVLAGRNSVDADTGQVPPQLAHLLDLPFATGVREIQLHDTEIEVYCELDDGWQRSVAALPALLSVAERLCEPAKVDAAVRTAVPRGLIRVLHGDDLGPGPWGEAASATSVGRSRVVGATRAGSRLTGEPVEAQVEAAIRVLVERGALGPATTTHADPVPEARPGRESSGSVTIAVIAEPDRPRLTAEMLGEAAALAAPMGGRVVALTNGALTNGALPGAGTAQSGLASQGADEIVQVMPSGPKVAAGAAEPLAAEDLAVALGDWTAGTTPWAVLAPSTAWGREVASRIAARTGSGLTGDSIGFEVEGDRLVSWKPAFGGRIVVAVTSSTPVQMATVRPGTLPDRSPRTASAQVTLLRVTPRGRVRVLSRGRDDDLDRLAGARAVVGVGQAVRPDEYADLSPLLGALGAEMGATRKVTDAGWLPRSRQIGITGRSVAPGLFVSIGARGTFNHMVGVRAAGTVLAINHDPDAPVLDAADYSIVGDWHVVVPLLTRAVVNATAELPPG